MSNRIIKSRARGSSVQLVSCLGSLFALELLKPSKELYLISPWLSKVPLIDNRFGQFRALASELDKSELHLGDILMLLAGRGTRVRILYRTPANEMTRQFLKSLQDTENIEYRAGRDLHEKGLITSHFYVHGSMNFTYAGVNINDESIEIIKDEALIWQALQEAKVSWEGADANDAGKL
jgi:phosphatidylserine/phosphatidylglycerophosphate/cardiolipin synthase-like enzyme